MRNITKRTMALLLVLTLALSLLPPIALTADAATVSVTYKQNGVTVSTVTADSSVVLPAHNGAVADGYTFVGWVTETIDGSATTAPEYYEARETFKITGATTFHALYSITEEGEGGTAVYEKVTTAPADWSGEYLIVYETGKLAFDGSRTTLDASGNSVAVEISDGTIAATEAMKKVQFTIAGTSGNYTVKSASGYYIGQTSNANGLKSNKTTTYNHSITFKSANEINLSSGGAYLRYNAAAGSGNLRFRYYKSSSYTGQKAIQLYKLNEVDSSVTTYVTSLTSSCAHANTENRIAVPAQCEQTGIEAGVFCTDCETYISGGAVIPALEHNMVAGTPVPPTENAQGYTTYTCANGCGKTEDRDFVPPTSATSSATLIAKVADLTAGTYKMAGYLTKNNSGDDISAAPYHLWNGTVSSNDLVTSSYAFADGALTAAGENDAADVTLVAVDGKENTYYIMMGEKYLYCTEADTSRRLALGDSPAEWVATDNKNGGITMTSNSVHLGTANANVRLIRSYKDESSLKYGVVFFKAGTSTPAPSIELTSVAASFDSAMTFNYVATKESLKQFKNVYVEFTAAGKETERVEGKLFTREGVQYYAFGFTQLNIRDLGLEVYATIHGTYNGQPVSGTTKSYSLLKYCSFALENDTGDELPCAYLLKYAQAAEEFKNVPANERLDVSALESKMATIFAANSAIEAAEPVRNTAYTPGTQITFAGQNVNMATRVSMIYYLDLRSYTGDQEKVTVTVDYTDGVTGQPAQKTYQFSELVANSSEGFYEVHFGEHLLTQMNDEITCTVYIGDVVETSYQNSIEHYCYTTVDNDNSSEAEKALAMSIYRYGLACKNAYVQ